MSAHDIVAPATVDTSKKRHFWTTTEISIVRQHYPAGGAQACKALLPHRSIGSICQQAAKLGAFTDRSRAARTRRQHRADIFSDAAIRAVYENAPRRNAVKDLADKIGKPRWWVTKRATALGLVVPRFKEAVWTEDEVDLLERNAHKSAAVIERIFRKHGYSRTATSITVKRKRLALGVTVSRQAVGLYSANQVATLMGVDAKTVTRWINLGMLKASRRPSARIAAQGGEGFEINAAALRKFIVDNPNSVDLRKVDRLWFIGLLGEKAA